MAVGRRCGSRRHPDVTVVALGNGNSGSMREIWVILVLALRETYGDARMLRTSLLNFEVWRKKQTEKRPRNIAGSRRKTDRVGSNNAVEESITVHVESIKHNIGAVYSYIYGCKHEQQTISSSLRHGRRIYHGTIEQQLSIVFALECVSL